MSSPTEPGVAPRRLGVWQMQPGGISGSTALIDALDVDAGDRIVDLAPGTGDTGLLATHENVYSWTGVCADAAEAEFVAGMVPSPVTHTQTGTPDRTGLPDECATVVISEGLLAGLAGDAQSAVVEEAARLLRPNGRFGLHELCLRATGLSEPVTAGIRSQLAEPANGSLNPLTEVEWCELLRGAGLDVESIDYEPVALPTSRAVIRHNGLRRGRQLLRRAGAEGAPGEAAGKMVAAQRGRFAGIVIVARRPYVGALRARV
jgi:hypothetical protein